MGSLSYNTAYMFIAKMFNQIHGLSPKWVRPWPVQITGTQFGRFCAIWLVINKHTDTPTTHRHIPLKKRIYIRHPAEILCLLNNAQQQLHT